jgi:hypothetical protein
MFNKKSVLILGAGASCQYGYPTGDGLVSDIIETITTQKILWPKNSNNLSIKYMVDVFKDIPARELINNIDLNLKNERYYLTIKGTQIHLEMTSVQFESLADDASNLQELAKDLKQFNPVSIDKFLKDHEKYRECGKLMIAYQILKSEREKFFEHRETGLCPHCHGLRTRLEAPCAWCSKKTQNDHPKYWPDNWYRLLLNKITDNCQQPSDILKNDVDILTFNYDVSLDCYLRSKLLKTEFFSEYALQYLNDKNPLKDFHHIYGMLHSPIEDLTSIQFTGYGFEDLLLEKGAQILAALNSKHGSSTENANRLMLIGFLNLIRLINAYRTMNNIQVIGEEKSRTISREAIHKLIRAEELYFIGFGFDANNQNVLALPDILCGNMLSPEHYVTAQPGDEIRHLLSHPINKKVYWHNYKGQYNSLGIGLRKHIEKNTGELIESQSASISDAWTYDFATQLLEAKYQNPKYAVGPKHPSYINNSYY